MDAIPRTLKVQWRIGNECNFKCGYCHPSLYGGDQLFKTEYDIRQGILNLNYSTEDYHLVEIELQGGEPTSKESIRNIIKTPINSKIKFVLHTNTSADLDWWQESIGNCSKLILAWHSKIDPNHFKAVVNLARANNINYTTVVNAENTDPGWGEAIAMHFWLKANHHPNSFKILFENYQRGNNKFLSYNQEQWEYYTTVNNIQKPADEPLVAQIKYVEAHLYDNYYGHLCWAGYDRIVVDYQGNVFRGWCHSSDAPMGNIIRGPIKLDDTPKVCPKSICKNAFDKEAKKSKNSWGLS